MLELVAARRPPLPELGAAKSQAPAFVTGSAGVLAGDAAVDFIMAATTLGGAAEAKNFYAVHIGRKPVIYFTCDECKS